MTEHQATAPDDRPDVGPDPVWPLGAFIFGLLVMAMGGAFTWHWVFVFGEAFLLLGVVWFLSAVAITRLKQDPIAWREKLPAFLGGTAEEREGKPRRKKVKTSKKAEAPRLRKKKVKKAKRRKKIARVEE